METTSLQSNFFKSRFRGFLGTLVIILLLWFLAIFFQFSPIASAIFNYGSKALLLVLILFGLTKQKYKIFAQGALVSWVIFVLAPILFIFLNLLIFGDLMK